MALIASVRMPQALHGGLARTPGPDDSGAGLPRAACRALVAAVLALHLLGAWALLQIEPVRQAVADLAPVFVNLVAAPAPAPAAPAPAPPPAARPRPATPPPRPLLAAAPRPAEAPATFAVPVQAEPEPQQPAPAAVAPTTAAPVAAAAPPAPPPAPPPTAPPRAIPPTAVRYLLPPAPVYPLASRRLGESGEVRLRVEIDAEGHTRQLRVAQSSGSPRLDDAALAAVRAARFAPYTDNGVPLAVWTVVPIAFELEN